MNGCPSSQFINRRGCRFMPRWSIGSIKKSAHRRAASRDRQVRWHADLVRQCQRRECRNHGEGPRARSRCDAGQRSDLLAVRGLFFRVPVIHLTVVTRHGFMKAGSAHRLSRTGQKQIKGRNELRHSPGHVIEFALTFFELAEITKSTSVYGEAIPAAQGRTLIHAFTTDVTIPRDKLCWLHEGNLVIRIGDWKLVAANDNPWSLCVLRRPAVCIFPSCAEVVQFLSRCMPRN